MKLKRGKKILEASWHGTILTYRFYWEWLLLTVKILPAWDPINQNTLTSNYLTGSSILTMYRKYANFELTRTAKRGQLKIINTGIEFDLEAVQLYHFTSVRFNKLIISKFLCYWPSLNSSSTLFHYGNALNCGSKQSGIKTQVITSCIPSVLQKLLTTLTTAILRAWKLSQSFHSRVLKDWKWLIAHATHICLLSTVWGPHQQSKIREHYSLNIVCI